MAGKNNAIYLAKKFRERLKNLETTNRIRRKLLTAILLSKPKFEILLMAQLQKNER